jgi:uncharacterized protein (DUF885 family)
MKRYVVRCAFAGGLALAACAPQPPAEAGPAPQAATSPGEAGGADALARQVNAVADEYMAALLERNPELVTFYGIPGGRHDRLTDNSPAALGAWQARQDVWLARMAAMDPAPLDGRAERATYAILRDALESARATRACRNELWPVNQLTGWQATLPFLAQIQPVGTPELRSQALARARAVPGYLDTEIARLREGMRQGNTSPKVNVRRVLAQVDGILADSAATSPFTSPAARDSTPGFRREVEQVVGAQVLPAVRRYRDFLRDVYLPAAREDVAVAANTGGAACYPATIRSFTTLELTPRQVHEMGLRQMDKIQGEMRQIGRRSFGTEDVPALLQRFRTDRQFMFGTRAEMVAYARGALDRAKREMPKWFGTLPKADVVIEPYPEFQEASAPGGEYFSPSDDGSRPGTYRINTYMPETKSKVGLESTAFHETIPGHHLQIAIAQEQQGSHPVARFLFNSGYAEGWGLYSERLADEMGLFSSDMDRMGLLSNEALRAARLVVDPGMHALGWSRERAIDYMLKHTAESRDVVETEVDRYINWPGQATAYMVGNLEIRRLRETAERELGPKFDIREFHDVILQAGSVPLTLLGHNVELWIARKKAP